MQLIGSNSQQLYCMKLGRCVRKALLVGDGFINALTCEGVLGARVTKRCDVLDGTN